MLYIQPILIFLMVLSPLYIPIGVTVVGAISDWRGRTADRRRSAPPPNAATTAEA